MVRLLRFSPSNGLKVLKVYKWDVFFTLIFGSMGFNAYLCIVFFIVLDLRLTRLEYSGTPFFVSVSFRDTGLSQ